MSVNAINNYYGSTASAKTTKSEKTENTASKTDKKNGSTSASKTGTFDSTAVIYEKSSVTKKDSVTQKKDHAAIVAQMKADTEKRTQQLTDLVQQMISQQGKKLGESDSIWSFLAGGDFTVSPEVKAQAQADIAEDGYWGVEQTSDRILDFAKALSGDDPSKADELLNAFKKGFEQATKAWGKDLPSISQDTYKAVEEKFNKWKNESQTQTEE
ncbi:hypothetical protein FYJ75_04130 [Roseburia sp. MUC/MUC-530-WT-4D]|uniref:Uncharacterized protein n=1 Tax=Roseburia porci TaxID=2605790 RepID=A0A6L5YQS1_9FIRM|nr:hypothetical protein [Roseburia porci]MST74226.1 hypothetical protein [Roseburia porci]